MKFGVRGEETILGLIVVVELILLSLMLIFHGILILKGRKKTWWIVRIILWIGMLGIGILGSDIWNSLDFGGGWFFVVYIILAVLLGIPLLLLELDRKNFFKVAK